MACFLFKKTFIDTLLCVFYLGSSGWVVRMSALALPLQDSSVYLQTDKLGCKIAGLQLYFLKGCTKPTLPKLIAETPYCPARGGSAPSRRVFGLRELVCWH